MATTPMTKTPPTKNQKSLEQTLWDAADKLRGSVESSEYKHVVLSLIFLKFVSDKFEARRAELIALGQGQYADMVEFYTMKNLFYLPPEARWATIQAQAKQEEIALRIDTALHTLEKNNKALRGALPDNYFARLGLEVSKLAALIDLINNITTLPTATGPGVTGPGITGLGAAGAPPATQEEDLVGRVYEYFLGSFAATEGKGGGEFYTPKCVVNLIAQMIEPYRGKIYDPCCGSGGMFVQSVKFVASHQGNQKDISIYGQEQTATTYKLAKMNLAIRGIAANLGELPADTFFKDQHPDLKADFIMANPPFNLKEWRAAAELTNDPRWAGYEVPPTGNANYAWILHIIAKLSADGVAGFVLANGSMSTNTSGEGTIRRQIIENDLVDCMIALPGQLFYTTQIPVCLWFLSKNKGGTPPQPSPNQGGSLTPPQPSPNQGGSVEGVTVPPLTRGRVGGGLRHRRGETLFIDARGLGRMTDRTHKELTADEIATIARTYHAWRGERKDGDYTDQPGFCKAATLAEIAANDYVLTPGRYVGAAEVADDGVLFEAKMAALTQTLYQQMAAAQTLDARIRENLEALGYGE